MTLRLNDVNVKYIQVYKTPLYVTACTRVETFVKVVLGVIILD